MYTIFTDGASKGNPGPGGYGAIISDGKKVKEIGGAKSRTTNNEMELMSVVLAIEETPENCEINIYLDSSYVANGAQKWIFAWQKNDWKTKAKTDVLYQDLWVRLAELLLTRKIKWNRISGHSGLAGNERVDEIASSFASKNKPNLFSGAKGDYLIDLDNLSYSRVKKESKSRSREKAYSYVSRVNGKIEKHNSWADCELRVKGVSGARFKKSLSAEDEAGIIRSFSE